MKIVYVFKLWNIQTSITNHWFCHLESAVCVWYPYKLKDIEHIESVQIRAIRMLSEIKKITYEERQKKLDLPTYLNLEELEVICYKCTRCWITFMTQGVQRVRNVRKCQEFWKIVPNVRKMSGNLGGIDKVRKMSGNFRISEKKIL